MAAGALVVAAGFSRRFGSDKRLFTLRNGRSLLVTSLLPYLEVFRNVVVVVRSSDSAVTRHLLAEFAKKRPVIVTTAHADRGMAASLADGIRSVPDWEYAFIGLGDMPYLLPETLRLLERSMEEASGACIVQPTFEGRAGHPVGFSREFFGELIAVAGDQGARAVIARHPDALRLIPVTDPGVTLDLDRRPE